jgi:hypothetical protein
VRKLDLTFDGRDDYIVDFHDTECAGRQAVCCGTGGCSIEILMTLPNGRIRSVFSDRVGAHEILSGQASKTSAARTIRFELHGSFAAVTAILRALTSIASRRRPFAFKMSE